MGQVADDMINGLCCQLCGEYMPDFIEVGYPRTCCSCAPPVSLESFKKQKKEERREITKDRKEYVVNQLIAAGVKPLQVYEKHCEFYHKGEKVTHWYYTGWHAGKSIQDGRGISKLLKQIRCTKN